MDTAAASSDGSTDASSAARSAASTPTPVTGGLVLPALSLWQREMVRFFRQRNRVISAVATPLVFWLVLGLGLNKYFMAGTAETAAAAGAAGEVSSVGYLEYFFPGTIILMVLFTAIFSTISVIEDRREGFMQGVLVAPISRLAIVMGKVLGGASIATIQGTLLLLLWPFIGTMPSLGGILLAILAMFITAIGLTALGLCIAWPMDSTAAFHAIMNLFLMPMWLLSGALFPVTKVTAVMQWLMLINPLTYGHTALCEALMGDRSPAGLPLGLGTALIVAALSSALLVIFAMWIVSRPRKDGGL